VERAHLLKVLMEAMHKLVFLLLALAAVELAVRAGFQAVEFPVPVVLV
jgi:hypothetical protein